MEGELEREIEGREEREREGVGEAKESERGTE